jgi:hypothetical protein
MITTADVIAWLKITQNTESLDLIVPAVNNFVNSLPSIDMDPVFTQDWAAETKLAAIMLAARWYRRQNSPGGLTANEQGVTYVSKYDSDIARMLHIDGFEKPDVG